VSRHWPGLGWYRPGPVGNDYQFVTEWRVAGTVDEVKDVLGDGLSVPVWWPSVYLTVTQLAEGDTDGVGRVLDLYTPKAGFLTRCAAPDHRSIWGHSGGNVGRHARVVTGARRVTCSIAGRQDRARPTRPGVR
jgi:hypothetical protein